MSWDFKGWFSLQRCWNRIEHHIYIYIYVFYSRRSFRHPLKCLLKPAVTKVTKEYKLTRRYQISYGILNQLLCLCCLFTITKKYGGVNWWTHPPWGMWDVEPWRKELSQERVLYKKHHNNRWNVLVHVVCVPIEWTSFLLVIQLLSISLVWIIQVGLAI